MKIITDLSKFKKEEYPNLAVALGNFDGVHLGHQAIIRDVLSCAKQVDGQAAVMTFRQHPRRVLAKHDAPAILTSLEHKLILLERYGVDLCFLPNFTVEFSALSAEQFMVDILSHQLGVRQLCLGFNARFGHDRKGDSQRAEAILKPFGVAVRQMPAFQLDGQTVSSTGIRSLIEAGEIEKASRWLGRPYSFFGTVIKGHGRGKKVGYPTANLDPHSEVMPPEGVYGVWVRIFDCGLVEDPSGVAYMEKRLVGEHLRALLNYGTCPTFEADCPPLPEVHVLDFHNDLSGKMVEVEVALRIREERKFPDINALQIQIAKDIQTANAWFDACK